MEAKVNFALVGAFVMVLTTALIAGLLWLSSGKYYRKSYDTYLTYMTESVSGLNLNAPVRYRGVEVGRVRQIALAPGDVEQVQVTLDIDRGTPVKEDTVALLETQGLTGIAFVDLTGGHRSSPPLRAQPGQEYPVIKSTPSLMTGLETSVPALLADLERVTNNLNALTSEDNRKAVKGTLADLEVLSRTLAARSATIDAGLSDAARTMQNTARFTAQLPSLVQRLERSADAFDQMANKLASAGASATDTLEGSRAEVQQFTSETLPEVHQLVAELRGLTATLQHVGDEVERNPAILLAGRPPAKRGPGE